MTGMFKLDPETKRAANLEMAQAIEKITGVSPEEQDAIYDRIGSSGMRLSDIIPIDPANQKRLNEMNKFKLWAGLSNSVKPHEIRDTQDRIDEYWQEVEKKNTEGRVSGFKNSRGEQFESLASLDKQFREGKISGKIWLQKQANTRSEIASQIEGLKTTDRFKNVPITLEQRLAHYEKTGVPVPVDHPAKEIINLYYQLTPKADPKTGEPDWDTYYASIDSLIEVLPTERKAYFLDYIQRDWTPTQKLYWETNSKYMRPYHNMREVVLQNVVPEQRDFIRNYEKASAATIDNLPEAQKKLVMDFNAAVGRANSRYRQLSPTTEAWLYYFDKVSELSSEDARSIYNQITQRYLGPKPLDVPIKEKPSILHSLPSGEIVLNKDSSGRTISVTKDGVTTKITRSN
jgi:hypothetical protein